MSDGRQIIRVKLIAYTKQFRKRLKDSEKSIASFSKKSLAIGAVAGSASLAFTAVTASLSLLTKAYLEAAKTIPEMRKFFDMGRDAHVSAEFFQTWALAAERAGIELSRFGPILRFTDARIRQFRNGQGEFASGMKNASQETQDFFEGMKKLSNEEFMKALPDFFNSAASAADKNTVAVALWTENAGAMVNQIKEVDAAQRYLEDRDLLISDEDAATFREASNALSDINRETDIYRKRAVAKNIDAYVATRAGLEQLYLKWMQLLDTVGTVAVEIATVTGIIDPMGMVATVDRLSESYDAFWSSAEAARAEEEVDQAAINKLLQLRVNSELGSLDAKRLIKAAARETLELEKKQAEQIALRDEHEENLALAKKENAFSGAIEGHRIALKATQEEIDKTYEKLAVYQQITSQLREQIFLYDEQKKKDEEDGGFQKGYYPDLLNNINNAIAATDKARRALVKLSQERKAGEITLQQYTVGEQMLGGVLSQSEGYYDRLVRSAKEQVKQTKQAENALFKLKAGFKTLGMEEEVYLVVMKEVNKALGLTGIEADDKGTAMDRVLARIKKHREELQQEAADIAAAKQLINDPNSSPEQIAAAKELYIPKDDTAKRNKYIWELEGKEKTELFLKDFQSFSGQLSEAMLDAETDWDKFWLNMIKRMAQRNLARYINDAFEGMINALKGSNKKVLDETQKMTKNMQDATGASSGGGAGFGWGSLLGGLATLGAAYYMSRNMNDASTAASGSGGSGDTEIIVNINNTSSSRVAYDGRQISDQNGIRQQVINIVVDDYQTGGAIRQAFG